MSKYLTHESPNAFLDHPVMDRAQAAKYNLTKQCPKCLGHGGWNLLLNQYPMPKGMENTPANRSKYTHFRASCSHCNGWGYVRQDEMCPGHEWVFVRNTGRCLNLHECKHCGKQWEIDSSD